MRQWIISAITMGIVLALYLCIPAVVANADNGPHMGNFTPTTDACAGCHRVHRGRAENLLTTASEQDLCYSCHGSPSNGATTDVVDGVSTVSGPSSQTGLRAGGFVYALMDTDYTDTNNIGVSRGTTSAHSLGIQSVMWGNGSAGVGKGGVTLRCTSCHNPHGGAATNGGPTYRILRSIPIDSDATVGINVTDTAAKKYTLTDEPGWYQSSSGRWFLSKAGNQYFGEWYDEENGDSRPGQLSQWCAQCHTRYLATAESGHHNSGDGIFPFRHTSDQLQCMSCHFGGYFEDVPSGPFVHLYPVCLSCHVAHGTAASMTGDGITAYSQSVEWPSGALPVDPNQNSRLLRLDNRGICVQCHTAP